MTLHQAVRAVALGAAVMIPAPLSAQDDAAVGLDPDRLEQARYVLNTTRPGDRIGAALDRFVTRLRQADMDGEPGIGAGDIELRVDVALARQRSSAAARLLQFDLDGDGAVTAEEVMTVARPEASEPLRSGGTTVTPTEAQVAEILTSRVASVMEQDLDEDGAVTVAEATALVDTPEVRATQRVRIEREIGIPGHFDLDADGTVTEAELRLVVETYLKLFDIDGDGTVSGNERNASSRTLNTAQQEISRQNHMSVKFGARDCRFPSVAPDAQVVVLGAAEGSALTDLGVPGRHSDDPVTMAEIVVPEGVRPIHIVGGFRKPVLLRLAGPGKARVTRVTGLAAPVLVTGQRVETDAVRCHSMIWHMTDDSLETLHENLKRGFRRADVMLFGGWTLGRVALAKGENDIATRLDGALPLNPTRPPSGLLAQLDAFNPGGFHLVPSTSVLSSEEPAFSRSVWPQEAGLLQLVGKGALEPVLPEGAAAVQERIRADDPRFDRFRNGPRGAANDPAFIFDDRIWREQSDGSWIGQSIPMLRATRAVTLPVGLEGAHSVRIVTASGVPKPDGGWVKKAIPNRERGKLPQIGDGG